MAVNPTRTACVLEADATSNGRHANRPGAMTLCVRCENFLLRLQLSRKKNSRNY